MTHIESVQKNPEHITSLFNTAMSGVDEVFIPAVELGYQCVLYNQRLSDTLFQLIRTELLDPQGLQDSGVGNDNELKELYRILLRKLIGMGEAFADKSNSVINILLEFLLEIISKYNFQQLNLTSTQSMNSMNNNNFTQAVTFIKDEAIQCLCDIVKVEIIRKDVDSVRWILDSLSHSLYTQYSNYMRIDNNIKSVEKDRKEKQLNIIVTSLGRITCQLNHASITDYVLPNLINRITYPDLTFDAFIIGQLTEIALLGHKTAYTQVVELLVNIYKNCLNYPDNKYIHNTIPNAFARLASGLTIKSLRKDLLFRLLKLFQLLANQIIKKEPKQRTGILGFLGILLPILSDLISTYNSPFIKSINNLSHSSSHSSTNSNSSSNNANESSNTTTTTRKSTELNLFTSVWYYCVLYRFTYRNHWATDWYEAITKIAEKMPPLISEKSTTLLESTMIIESFPLSQHEVSTIRKELSDILLSTKTSTSITNISAQAIKSTFFSSNDYVKNLTNGNCIYLLSVFHLEILRIRNTGNLTLLFKYLQDASLHSNSEISHSILSIIDHVFNSFLSNTNHVLDSTTTSGELQLSNELLVEIVQLLLFNFVHSETRVRKAADKYLLQFLDKFPKLLWNSKLLKTLLDLHQAISKGLDHEGHATIRCKLPNSSTNSIITLPEHYQGRLSMMKEIKQLCTVWIQSAKREAPVETNCLLQEYFQQFQTSSGFLVHSGYSLAVQLITLDDDYESTSISGTSSIHSNSNPSSGSNASSVSNANASLKSNESLNSASSTSSSSSGCGIRQSPSSFINSIQLKSTYLGEVLGMVELCKQWGSEVSKLQVILVNKLRNYIIKSKKGDSIDMNEFNNDLCKAAAFLITQKDEIYRSLIHLVCWSPIIVFTEKSIQSGIFIWTWLLAVRTDLNLLIMNEIKLAWLWSIQEGIGLFNNQIKNPSPLSIPKKSSGSSPKSSSSSSSSSRHSHSFSKHGNDLLNQIKFYKKKHSNPNAHGLLLDFFHERLIIAKNNSPAQMDIIEQILFQSIIKPSQLSEQTISLPVRFKLLLLSVHFLQSNHLHSKQLIQLYTERIYLNAMDWFTKPPTWYDPGNKQLLNQHVTLLVEFAKAFEDSLHQPSETTLRESNTKQIITNNLPNLPLPLPNIGDAQVPVTGFISRVIDSLPSRDKSISSLVDKAIPSRGFNQSQTNQDAYHQPSSNTYSYNPQLHKLSKAKIQLLLLFIGHEIDRICAWHNPQNRIQLTIPYESRYSTANLTQNSNSWRRHIFTAW